MAVSYRRAMFRSSQACKTMEARKSGELIKVA